MSLASIARTKKRTGELSFTTKAALFKEAVGEKEFNAQAQALLVGGRILYNQLRVDGVLPKRAKAWDKIDYQEQLKWGASALDLLVSLNVEGQTSDSWQDIFQTVLSALSPKTPSPEMLNAMMGGVGEAPAETPA